MFKKANTHSVLMAAVVALVGVVGMFMFAGDSGAQGAQTIVLPAFENTLTAQTGRIDSDYRSYEMATTYGEQLYEECLVKAPYETTNRCCKRLCADACHTPSMTDELCQEKCSNVCQNRASQALGVAIRTR